MDACLLVAVTGEVGPAEASVRRSVCPAPGNCAGSCRTGLGFQYQTYRRMKHLEGLKPYQWRSEDGTVMELSKIGGKRLLNKLGEEVSIEPDYLFPLLKCSDLANGRLEPERCVVVTQRKVGDDTAIIAKKAPLTWRYLNSHRDLFEAWKRVPFIAVECLSRSRHRRLYICALESRSIWFASNRALFLSSSH